MQVDSLAKLEFVPGAISALKVLRGLDFELVMATNQDGLGTDSFPEEDFRIPQEKMLRTLAGEGVLFDDMLIDRTFESDGAPTRKPRTGMFGRYTGGGYDLAASYVVGDRATDILLARNLGARGILFAQETAGRRMLREAGAEEPCVLISDSWSEIAEYIRRGERRVVVTRETRETRITVRLDLDGKGFGGVSPDRPAAGTGSGSVESGTDTGNRVGTGADNGPDDNRADTGNTTKGIRSHTDDMTSSDRAGAKIRQGNGTTMSGTATAVTVTEGTATTETATTEMTTAGSTTAAVTKGTTTTGTATIETAATGFRPDCVFWTTCWRRSPTTAAWRSKWRPAAIWTSTNTTRWRTWRSCWAKPSIGLWAPRPE